MGWLLIGCSSDGVKPCKSQPDFASCFADHETVAPESESDVEAMPALEFAVAPTFSGSPNPNTRQVGVLHLQANRPVTLTAVVNGGGEEWQFQVQTPSLAITAPVLGLKPNTSYSIDLIASDGAQELTADSLTWTTPALPEGFPIFDVVVSEPERMEPGMTLFNARSPNADFLVIVDNTGTVRWYNYNTQSRVEHAHCRLADGSFLYVEGFTRMVEVDVFGNEIRSWYAANYPAPFSPPAGSIPVDVALFHHDAQLLASGEYLTMSNSLRTVEDFPTSEIDPTAPNAPAQVVGDEIIEFDAAGRVTRRIGLMDILDPRRIGRVPLRIGTNPGPASFSSLWETSPGRITSTPSSRLLQG